MKKILLSFVIIIVLFSCSKGIGELKEVEKVEIKTVPIEIIKEQEIEAFFIMGYNASAKELYLRLFREGKHHVVGIIDTDTGKVKRKFLLRSGTFQSPTDCYNPNYMQFLNDRYYVVDHSDKILIFDKDLNYLYSSMFHGFRYYIDFFTHEGQLSFVFGKMTMSNNEKTMGCLNQLYILPQDKRPELSKTLFKTSIDFVGYLNTKDEKKLYYSGELFGAAFGFAKDGKIYLSDTAKPQYFLYDLRTRETTRIPLAYLKKKKFSQEDADKAGKYRNGFVEKQVMKMAGKKFVYLPNPGDIFYFGLYDVGKNKIGIIGDVNLDEIKIRLDVFGTDYKYIESIWLPTGRGFFERLKGSPTVGAFYLCFDVDNGDYAFYERREDDEEAVVKLLKFKKKRID
jgi:hypothetical protein